MDEDVKTNLKRLGAVALGLVAIFIVWTIIRPKEETGEIKTDKGWYEKGIMTKDGIHFADAEGHVASAPPGFKAPPARRPNQGPSAGAMAAP